ncbi:class I SAM-dependent methyltransferase [Aquihabitans sp. McL0605]|uniref:class I SAM-dependent methyltransferase n=1 Tax=Aquihabitans sp. McL0605 TaxID=3415671 RepID=UPI003CF09061
MHVAHHELTVQAAYDLVAADYAELLADELGRKPFDRAVLGAFAELVRVGGPGPVGDLGCGPGRVTAHLHDLGLEPFGIDRSSAMVEVARASYPDLGFVRGTLAALPLASASLAGAVAWYSIIHTPPPLQPAVFAELARVLRPGGCLLLAFQVGDERVHLEQAYGHILSLDAYRLPTARVAAWAAEAGLDVVAELTRAPADGEAQPQAFLVVRRGELPA